ncbi:MAG: phospholipid carrier-dependent glycosyltransferase [Crenarchaeota archaeon]|nr:phospholipid carrier-dependent glycosyltransferase [Thermoproteota archaeon]
MDRRRAVTIAILVAIVALHVYLSVQQALFFEQHEIESMQSGAKGYVSDEVWYVDAARNILIKVFHTYPKVRPLGASVIYNNFSQLDEAAKLAKSFGLQLVLYKCGSSYCYSKLPALYVRAPSLKLIEEFANATHARDVVVGWPIGDSQNLDQYLNLEHPPLAKYLIAACLAFLGDRPVFWRIPSIACGAMLVVLAFLIVWEISRNEIAALLTAFLTAIDPLSRVMSSLAMLDIFVAAFTALALLFVVKRMFRAAVVATAVAACFKFNGIFALVPLLAYVIHEDLRRGERPLYIFADVLLYTGLTGLAFMAILVVVSIPLIQYLGFSSWFSQSVVGAIEWHLSTKCVGPSCPPASTPLDWFFGVNSFPLYIYDDKTIYAQGLVPFYAASFILALLSIPALAKRKPVSRYAWFLFMGLWICYVAIWFAGSHTQYSFYAVQLTPFVYAFLVLRVFELLDREELIEMFRAWYGVLRVLGSALAQLLG